MATLKLPQESLYPPVDADKDITPLVSVVIPTYNRAGLVQRAIHSVLAQTFSNLEVIIVDDASTDDTCDCIRTMQQVDHRIRYIRHEANQGAQAARNTGIRSSKGQYIAFLDSDNEWLPEKLQKQISLFSSEAKLPGAVYCGYRKISAGGDVLNEYIPQCSGLVYRQVLQKWLTDTSTLIVRKEILEAVHGFSESVRAYHEWDLCIRLSRKCAFDFVPECLTLYHEHALPTISKDFLRDAHGYLNVIDTYGVEMQRECGQRTLSNHYLNAGRLYVRADCLDLAKDCFLKSIRCDPLNLKAMLHFGVSLLGKDIYQFLRSQRQAKFHIMAA